MAILSLFPSGAASADGRISDLALRIVAVSPAGGIMVEMCNASQGPIRIWQDWNSWGAARWRVLVIRKGQLSLFFENPDQRFTKNFPAYDEIPPGGRIRHDLSVFGGNWLSAGAPTARFELGDTVVVTYDVPKSFDYSEGWGTVPPAKMGVWYGVAAAITTMR
jgi:hypothetical protein